MLHFSLVLGTGFRPLSDCTYSDSSLSIGHSAFTLCAGPQSLGSYLTQLKQPGATPILVGALDCDRV